MKGPLTHRQRIILRAAAARNDPKYRDIEKRAKPKPITLVKVLKAPKP